MSLSDFAYMFHTGCDPQDANFRDPNTCELLEVMPWPGLQDLVPKVINAIYSYLAALPHSEPGSAAQCTPAPQDIKHE